MVLKLNKMFYEQISMGRCFDTVLVSTEGTLEHMEAFRHTKEVQVHVGKISTITHI